MTERQVCLVAYFLKTNACQAILRYRCCIGQCIIYSFSSTFRLQKHAANLCRFAERRGLLCSGLPSSMHQASSLLLAIPQEGRTSLWKQDLSDCSQKVSFVPHLNIAACALLCTLYWSNNILRKASHCIIRNVQFTSPMNLFGMQPFDWEWIIL